MIGESTLTGDYVHDVELLSARVRTLEAECTRRTAAQAEEKEKYQRDRQVWAEKKKAWAAHEERLKQRKFRLRDLLISWLDGGRPVEATAHALAELQRSATTSPAAPTPGGET